MQWGVVARYEYLLDWDRLGEHQASGVPHLHAFAWVPQHLKILLRSCKQDLVGHLMDS